MPSLLSQPAIARFTSRFEARFESWTAAPPPALAVEIASAGLRLARRGVAAAPDRVWTRDLPAGQIVLSAVQPNLPDPAPVAALLRALLASAGLAATPASEVTLLVPDLTARVAVLDFDTLPARRDELPALARFRLRKSLPFPEDRAALSCQIIGPSRLLVAVADRIRLDEYEDCLEAAGARAAVILPSSLAALAALPALQHAALLVRRDGPCLTTAFGWQDALEFFRVMELGADAGFDDVFPSIAFYRDRLEAAGHLADAVLIGAGLGPELEAHIRAEIPWAQFRAADAPAELAVRGAVRGQFA